ncbi:MAG: DsbE family thiol:disulfide interchange protein [Gammaproteobacteria bacterium]|jgi:cytochrome c biogenesis protein CcmG/thiol:disulfide interchange protein DsbE|nr:DsbE family thiol:disulfide interchange protein [Gammaproteobacteria bacterium]
MSEDKHPSWQRLLLLIPVLLAFGLGLFLYQGLGKDPNKLESSLLGQQVPDFIGESLAEPVRAISRADILGTPSLLNVWATWCPTCKAEHAYLNELVAREGVRIIGVNYHDQRGPAQEWLVRLGNPYAFSIYDPKGQLGIELGVIGAPETYLVDADGTIVDKLTGELNERTWAQLKPQYEALMARQSQ